MVHSSLLAPSECVSWREGFYHKASRVKSSPLYIVCEALCHPAVLPLLCEFGAELARGSSMLRFCVTLRLGVHSKFFLYLPFLECA